MATDVSKLLNSGTFVALPSSSSLDTERFSDNHVVAKPWSGTVSQVNDIAPVPVAPADPPGLRMYACRYCPYVDKRKTRIIVHERTHTDERPFQCDVCGRAFRRQEHVMYHRRIHTGEKQYKCSICSHAFIQKVALKNHMQRHTGEKRFRCDLCTEAFAYKYQLQRHLLNH